MVLYIGRQDSFDAELYVVPADGSLDPLRIVEVGDIRGISWNELSPDGEWAVFTAIHDVNSVAHTKLFAVPTDGSSPPIILSGEMVLGGNVYTVLKDPEISADSKTVTYLADQDVDEVLELYQVPIDGSRPPVKVNTPLNAGRVFPLTSFETTPFGIVHKVEDPTTVNITRTLYTNTFLAPGVRATGYATIADDDLLVDYGDAPSAEQSGLPADYPVTFEQDGARHAMSSLFLGADVDVEQNGQPHSVAGQDSTGGDDANEDPSNAGIHQLADMVSSILDTTSSLSITASNTGKIDGWIDFNRDGDWEDAKVAQWEGVYVDTSGDNQASARDALLVINFLGVSQQNSSRESELVGFPANRYTTKQAFGEDRPELDLEVLAPNHLPDLKGLSDDVPARRNSPQRTGLSDDVPARSNSPQRTGLSDDVPARRNSPQRKGLVSFQWTSPVAVGGHGLGAFESQDWIDGDDLNTAAVDQLLSTRASRRGLE